MTFRGLEKLQRSGSQASERITFLGHHGNPIKDSNLSNFMLVQRGLRGALNCAPFMPKKALIFRVPEMQESGVLGRQSLQELSGYNKKRQELSGFNKKQQKLQVIIFYYNLKALVAFY